MYAHESAHQVDSQPRRKPRNAGNERIDGHAFALNPDSVLRLQRTAGNAAVTAAITVQRKKMQEYSDGQVTGMFTYMDDKSAPRQASISVTEAWFS